MTVADALRASGCRAGPITVARHELEPILALARADRAGALAVICGVDGPSYRPLGAFMAVFDDGTMIGNLSSGCIEADIGHHALQVLDRGKPAKLRYGRGSPFIDITLPCGGGLDILIVPNPDRRVLGDLMARHENRQPCVLSINTQVGCIAVENGGQTGLQGAKFLIRIEPCLRFLVFGAGPETVTFGALVQSMGFPNTVFSPDARTLDALRDLGSDVVMLSEKRMPTDTRIDDWTAVTLFFHDHDWEPPLLGPLLASRAFFVGAQGSQRAAAARRLELEALGVSAHHRNRLRGPIGLIPSTRNAHSLAISVLAEILAAEQR